MSILHRWLNQRRWLLWVATLVYFAALLRVILFKYSHSFQVMLGSVDRPPLSERIRFINLVPFRSIAFYLTTDLNPWIAVENLAGNLLAFVPLGFLVPLLFPRLNKGWHTAAVSFAVSLSLEMVQLLTAMGQFDIDDLLVNVLGAIVGWMLLRGLVRVGI
ncbi:MAG: hypothetical protein K0R39_2151 [Symbiobacteriaceae bacterium]|nr:hypothetical protein [Symbiobacteriaceae bacterium]